MTRCQPTVRMSSIAWARWPRWLAPFLCAGLHVVLELPKPILLTHPFRCADWFSRRSLDCAGGPTEQRGDLERCRAPVVVAIRPLVAELPGVGAWDSLPALRDAKLCGALDRSRPLLFHADHLSPNGSLVLLPSFRSAIARP